MRFLPARFALLRQGQDASLTGRSRVRLYLGVDGGQSSTTALIADETGAVIGRGREGPCNHVTGAEAVDKFSRVIGGCVRKACVQAGLDPEAVGFAAACLGFSGGAEDKRVLTQALIRSDRYAVTHDAEIALTGATAGEPGIIVIAGTGSMAFGRNQEGTYARAGGWGYVFGDEGGAFDIVRRALRAALRFEEGWGAATSLSSRLCDLTSTPKVNAALHAFYTPEFPRSKVASFAQVVNEEAESGDVVALEILKNAGKQLAGLVRGVYGQLFGGTDRPLIAPIGGTFSSAILRRSFAEQVLLKLDVAVSEPKWSPAAGAVLQAMRMDGNGNFPHGAGLAAK